jgi:hypothetical protein
MEGDALIFQAASHPFLASDAPFYARGVIFPDDIALGPWTPDLSMQIWRKQFPTNVMFMLVFLRMLPSYFHCLKIYLHKRGNALKNSVEQ